MSASLARTRADILKRLEGLPVAGHFIGYKAPELSYYEVKVVLLLSLQRGVAVYTGSDKRIGQRAALK